MSPTAWLLVLFFCSGVSGLIYQVVWVRQFGQIYGNTVYSASIVVAIFILGLGAGSYVFGVVADRWHRTNPDGLIRLYARLELVIGGLGLVISLTLPHLAAIVARLSSYDTGPDGWQALSPASYVWRTVVAVLLIGPITLLMGGTLSVLIRARVADLDSSGWRVATIYAVNTVGAAAGAFLTDFVLAPAAGLLATQLVAVALNLGAAGGASYLGRGVRHRLVEGQSETRAPVLVSSVAWPSLALALSGFATLGLEMLWLRHLSVLLGGFRAVLSLMLTVMLLAMGLGALFGGWIDRRFGQPARTWMIVQGAFAMAMLAGVASNSAETLAAHGASIAAALAALSPSSRAAAELWFTLRPMLIEVALPSFISGLAFPLANAIAQRTQDSVGRRAGVLYAANTFGAVSGSLVTGYVLLPRLGMQSAAAVLAAVAVVTIAPLFMVCRDRRHTYRPIATLAGASIVGAGAVVVWLALPADFVVRRALASTDREERVLTRREGVTELLAVVERTGRGRGLLTNGHAMSSTATLDQRYMRALAHIPLLSMERPERVLVIGFGVGNTTHAATLHASVTKVDVADLSRNILAHAGYFSDANRGVLRNPKVSVFVNDGRQHLQMAAPASYDLITLEPPPIAHAGVAALYSREFYTLARSRLKAGGYLSQWLPAYQVPAESSLAMVRAFLEVFPQSVLLSGAQAELLLVGTTAARIELDPASVAARLEREPAVREDLARVDLGTVREIAGTFVGSAETLARATADSPAVTDDHPLQEYGVRSGLSTGLMGVPSSLFDLTQVSAWCTRCLDEGSSPSEVADLDLYLGLLQQAYLAPVIDVARAAASRSPGLSGVEGSRRIWGSAYLGAVLPDSADVHTLLANLGQRRYDEAAGLMESRRFSEALPLLRMAVDLLPDSAEVQNDIGVTLASMGRIGEALPYFERAVSLKPDFAEALRNRTLAASRPPP